MRYVLISSILAACILLFAPTAQAEETKTTNTKEGYGYEFEDDPLAAGGFGPNDTRIRVRRGAQRATLIRPRTNFIPELLKSVNDV